MARVQRASRKSEHDSVIQADLLLSFGLTMSAANGSCGI